VALHNQAEGLRASWCNNCRSLSRSTLVILTNLKWSPRRAIRRRTTAPTLTISWPYVIPNRPVVPGSRSSEQRTTVPVLVRATHVPVRRMPPPTNPMRILCCTMAGKYSLCPHLRPRLQASQPDPAFTATCHRLPPELPKTRRRSSSHRSTDQGRRRGQGSLRALVP